MKTLLLDQDMWDLLIDASGNIALAGNPYSRSQDVSSACRLFAGELWYDTSKGIPYFTQVFGKNPPSQLLKAYYNRAALSVPEVVQSQTVLSFNLRTRTLSGQVQFIDVDGVKQNARFN